MLLAGALFAPVVAGVFLCSMVAWFINFTIESKMPEEDIYVLQMHYTSLRLKVP